MRFALLGSLRLEGDPAVGPPPALPRLRKAQGLLAYLLLFHDRAHPRTQLVDLYWGDVAEERARSSLSVALTALRPVLASTGAWLEADRQSVCLHLGTAHLDVAEVEAALVPDAPRARLAAGLRLYTGDLLDGWSEDWCLSERERLRRAVLRAGTRQARAYLAAGEWAAGRDLVQQLLRHDPLDETLHDLLLRLLLGADDYAEARRHYQATAALFRNDLNLEPGAGMQQLYAQALGRPLPTLGAPAAPVSAGRRLPFVGRERERQVLHEALERAAAGSGRLLLLAGAAGVGKTRLVEDLLRLPGKYRVARGRSREVSATVPYAPLVGLLNEWFVEQFAPPQVLARLGPTGTATLVQLLPRLGARLPQLRPLPALLPAEEHTRLLESVVSALLSLGTPHTPLVLFIDDLQWADPYTLQVLDRLGEHLVTAPLMVLGTYRSEEVVADSPLAQLIAHRAGEPAVVQVLEIPPLTAAEVGDLIEPRVPARQALLSPWLWAQTGGNAFYLAELLRSLSESGRIVPDPVGGGWRLSTDLPDRVDWAALPQVQQGIGARLGRLSHAAQVVIQLVATLDEPGDLDVLQAASGLSEEDALAGLEEGLARGFLHQPAPGVRFTLTHDLIRQAVYGALSTPRRMRLHARIGQALERLAADPTALDLAPRLAYHYGRSANTAKQRKYLGRAAEHALQRYAFAAAIPYYQQLLAVLEPAAQPPLLVRLGDAQQYAGHWLEAETTYREAARCAEGAGDSPTQAGALLGLARLLLDSGRRDLAVAPAAAAYALYERLADGAGLMAAAEMRGLLHWWHLEYAAALPWFNEQLRLAQAAGDSVQRLRGLTRRANVYTYLPDRAQAQRDFDEALALATRLGDLRESTFLYWSIGHLHTLAQEYAAAVRMYSRAVALGQEIGYHPLVQSALNGLANAYLHCGDLATAETCYLGQVAYALSAHSLNLLAATLISLAKIDRLQGRLPAAEANMRRTWRLLRYVGQPMYLLKTLLALLGLLLGQERYGEAQAVAAEAQRLAELDECREDRWLLRLLTAQLDVALQRVTSQAARAAGAQLLTAAATGEQRAAAHQWIGQLDPAESPHRVAAAALYRALYLQTYDIDYRVAYAELADDALPDPPPLPALPTAVRPVAPDAAALLAAVDAFIAALPESDPI